MKIAIAILSAGIACAQVSVELNVPVKDHYRILNKTGKPVVAAFFKTVASATFTTHHGKYDVHEVLSGQQTSGVLHLDKDMVMPYSIYDSWGTIHGIDGPTVVEDLQVLFGDGTTQGSLDWDIRELGKNINAAKFGGAAVYSDDGNSPRCKNWVDYIDAVFGTHVDRVPEPVPAISPSYALILYTHGTTCEIQYNGANGPQNFTCGFTEHFAYPAPPFDVEDWGADVVGEGGGGVETYLNSDSGTSGGTNGYIHPQCIGSPVGYVADSVLSVAYCQSPYELENKQLVDVASMSGVRYGIGVRGTGQFSQGGRQYNGVEYWECNMSTYYQSQVGGKCIPN